MTESTNQAQASVISIGKMIKVALPIVAFLFLPILAAATAPTDISIRDANSAEVQRRQGIPASMCATELLCCNSVTRADDPATAQILALLGIYVQPYDVVGLTCTPIIGIGVAQNICNAQPVCCWWGAEYGYLVALECTPVEI